MIKKYLRKIFKKEQASEKLLEKKVKEKAAECAAEEKRIIKKIRENIRFCAGIVFAFFLILAASGYFYWNKVILGAETDLKFGFATDFEYGYKDKIGNKLTSKAPEGLEKAVNFFNNEFHPEIVIAGGDMVESSLSKKNTTIEQFGKINAIFSKLQARRGYVFGNHDLRDLSKEELRNILGMQGNHSYFDIGDWRFVLMDTNFRIDGSDRSADYYVEGFVNENEFSWLKEALDTKKPTVLFSHHSSIPSELEGKFISNTKNLANGIDLHNFLKQYENLVLFVSGHEPGYRFQNIDGINYLIVGNLVAIDAVNFASLEAKYNKYTKKTKIIIEKHGEHAQKFEIEKKIGKFNLW